MKIKLSKDNIILIALLYNYLANYELELYEWRIQSFLDIIKRKLQNENSEIEIVDEEIEEQSNQINKYIEKSEDGKTYKLINLCNIESWYQTLPKELINITLKNVVLPTIYAENLKLIVPIKKEYSFYQGIRKAYYNSEKSAETITILDLEREDAKNIQIKSITPNQTENIQEYIVSYSCDKCYKSIDLSVLDKRIAEKKEMLTKLKEKRATLLKLSTNKSRLQKVADELKELELEINIIDIELHGKVEPDNNPKEEILQNNSKEMISLASKYSDVFKIASIELSPELAEKMRPLTEIVPQKIEPIIEPIVEPEVPKIKKISMFLKKYKE